MGVLLPNSFVKQIDVGHACHIRLDSGDLPAYRNCCGIERRSSATGDEHNGALAGEGGRGSESDAACAARYNYHLVLEPVCHQCSVRYATSSQRPPLT
jgi:hypothetical protein